MIVPGIERVLVKRISNEQVTKNNVILPGQLKASENLFVGEVIHPGVEWTDEKGNTHKPQFKAGQLVYYSEYSVSALWDMGKVMRGEKTLGEIMNEENAIFVVAEDDIMAYEDDPKTIRQIIEDSKPTPKSETEGS